MDPIGLRVIPRWDSGCKLRERVCPTGDIKYRHRPPSGKRRCQANSGGRVSPSACFSFPPALTWARGDRTYPDPAPLGPLAVAGGAGVAGGTGLGSGAGPGGTGAFAGRAGGSPARQAAPARFGAAGAGSAGRMANGSPGSALVRVNQHAVNAHTKTGKNQINW